MKIFKTKNTRTIGGRFIGVILTKQIASYLRLYSLAKGIAKSTIIRGQMQRWYSQEQNTNPENELVKFVVNEIQKEFEFRRKQHDAPTFDAFKLQVEDELKRKGIDKDHISTILTMLGP